MSRFHFGFRLQILFLRGKNKMITKNDMRKLSEMIVKILRERGLSDEEILGTITLIINNEVAHGIYKEDLFEQKK